MDNVYLELEEKKLLDLAWAVLVNVLCGNEFHIEHKQLRRTKKRVEEYRYLDLGGGG